LVRLVVAFAGSANRGFGKRAKSNRKSQKKSVNFQKILPYLL